MFLIHQRRRYRPIDNKTPTLAAERLSIYLLHSHTQTHIHVAISHNTVIMKCLPKDFITDPAVDKVSAMILAHTIIGACRLYVLGNTLWSKSARSTRRPFTIAFAVAPPTLGLLAIAFVRARILSST
jgi:hypothetical protein